MLRAGLEPATCRLGVDNGNVAGPQQKEVAVVKCSRIAASKPLSPKGCLHQR